MNKIELGKLESILIHDKLTKVKKLGTLECFWEKLGGFERWKGIGEIWGWVG